MFPVQITGRPGGLVVTLECYYRVVFVRRGEIWIYLQKKRSVKKKKDQVLRAPCVGRHNSTRVDEGRKC